MTQVEITYTNLLSLLNEIVNHEGNANFIDKLSSPQNDEFNDYLDHIQQEIDEIVRSRDMQQLYPNYQILEDLLDNIRLNYPAFNLARYDELKTIIIISKVISDQIPDLTDQIQIDVAVFETLILDPTLIIPQYYYVYENPIMFENSIILFSPAKFSTLEQDLRNSSITVRFLFIFLSKIGITENILGRTKYVLIKSGHAGLNNRINAFLLLQLISDGLVIHVPKQYSLPISNPWKHEIQIENKYQQFSDIFDVISEYNSSRDIIEKYLKLYQVVEDYMYKSALVKLEREKNGQIFSLRDFKRMNEQVSTKEIVALKDFITVIFDLQVSSNLTFKMYCLNQWVALLLHHPSVNEINAVITEYKILDGDKPYTHASVNANNLTKFFAHLIYYMRNSIVHNKTTEFHLTYRTLNREIFIILEKFLIPNLEKIIFYITAKPLSQVVWFQNPALNIWPEN